MANTEMAMRTNRFKVRNIDSFMKFMKGFDIYDCISVFREDNGTVALGTYDGLDDERFDQLVDGIQKHIPEDEAVIITAIEHEKLRMVYSCLYVITCSDIQYRDTYTAGLVLAREMLDDPEFMTVFE